MADFFIGPCQNGRIKVHRALLLMRTLEYLAKLI
jgi:hypothetical protein